MSWIIEEKQFRREKIELNGNKFLLGNGYMGYRGTLEEYSRDQLVSCNLSGLYDRVEGKWREPVNAPNGLLTRIYCDEVLLDAVRGEIEEHSQYLDIRSAVHKRETLFRTQSDNRVSVKAERFLGLKNVHLICMKYSFTVSEKCGIRIETGIDGDVWDINGPHLKNFEPETVENIILLNSLTNELSCKVSVAEGIERCFSAAEEIVLQEKAFIRQMVLEALPGETYTFYKYVSVFTGNDGVADVSKAASESCRDALSKGYASLQAENMALWEARWEQSDVEIEGDDEAQQALRYSLYHLLAIAPTHSDRVSIPARGLSGQVYKGAIFWDTEMFMLPFFIYTNPSMARNLIKYRVHTLDGARRKAAEYGFRGAFYAWESQETGDDACTYFNVTDVFTNRPMRTYFRDKQVHISTDVVYGIWQYYMLTGDESVLLEGGAEVILECARFLFSYSYYKKEKNRYEILDVTGPDEYHERVDNNVYTNRMARNVLEVAEKALELLKANHIEVYNDLMSRLNYKEDLEGIREMQALLYVPEPQANSLVIEQFDGYHRLEEVGLKELKGRVLNPNEYWGGGNGIATTTKIIKQADAVLMLNLFKDSYSHEVKKANWEYYEPRTEHGSSLSPCVYAMLAADIGNPEWAYKYFIKTATIDLTGDSKQYVGDLYIGGTHPAANGGAWMAAVLGFGGVHFNGETLLINPNLPSKWESLAFNLIVREQHFKIKISKTTVSVEAESDHTGDFTFQIGGRPIEWKEGRKISVQYR